MSKCADLFGRATNNPNGLRFAELCELAVCNGWYFDRQRGSHHIYKRPGYFGLMDFQEGPNGMAKPYQVRQLLRAIESASINEE